MLDFEDNFNGPLNNDVWERYGWGGQRVTKGSMGWYDVKNVYTENGNMILRTQYRDNEWYSAGVSSQHGFKTSMGKWEIRAKFDRAYGIGYAFMLWPTKNGVWPPEVDYMEGTVNGPGISSNFHFLDDEGKQRKAQRKLYVGDMTQWNTYGVILDKDKITYTFNGKPWAVLETKYVPTIQLKFAFQTGAHDPNDPNMRKWTEVVEGGKPNADTPAESKVYIDYVKHWRR